MSSEHQQYSTQNQSAAIAAYATSNAMVVARSYRDEGRSGLELKGRPALQRLLTDVREGRQDFDVVLVFDVSRWGRFQHGDEAAYHEFVCHLAGVRVIYVAELFSNDSSPLSAVLKGLKRAMAAEYSRELSGKVYAGQARLIERGYRQGGAAGYGLRRMRVDATGRHLGLLERGQYKAFATDRVILVPGPSAEVARVRGMYRDFSAGVSVPDIARKLNASGHLNAEGKLWQNQHVRMILTNGKYVGDNLFGMTHGPLNQARTRAPERQWLRCKNAFKPIVSRQLFAAVRAQFVKRRVRPTDEEMLDALRIILEREGRLSTRLIQAEPGVRSIPAYMRRFGGLRQIYARLGFNPPMNLVYVDARVRFRAIRVEVITAMATWFKKRGVHVTTQDWQMVIDHAWSLSIVVVRASMYGNLVRFYVRQVSPATDIQVIVRVSIDRQSILDYVVWPRLALGDVPPNVSSLVCPAVASLTISSLALLMDRLGYADPNSMAHIKRGTTQRKMGYQLGDPAFVHICRSRLEEMTEVLPLIAQMSGVLAQSTRQVLVAAVILIGSFNESSVDGNLVRLTVLSSYVALLLCDAELVGRLAQHYPKVLADLQRSKNFLDCCPLHSRP